MRGPGSHFTHVNMRLPPPPPKKKKHFGSAYDITMRCIKLRVHLGGNDLASSSDPNSQSRACLSKYTIRSNSLQLLFT